jgi:hypothetical protein
VNWNLRTGNLADVARDILAYLVEHSRAQDTLEGIVQWWVLEQSIKRGTAEVQTALAELVAQGLVLERQAPFREGSVSWRRKP